MSYEKFIGFDQTNSHLVARMGVSPFRHRIKDLLPPKKNKEPEPKLLLPRPSDFAKIRDFITRAQNGFLIPGQINASKDPLVSVLLDTKENGFPTAEFAQGQHSFRYRFELQSHDGRVTNRDFNEKSSCKTAEEIGGCLDRDEREYELEPQQSLSSGYIALKNKYRKAEDPAFCDRRKIHFNALHVLGSYIAARTEMGFAIKLPGLDLLIVFEGCEDIFETYTHDLGHSMAHLYEFEFEPKEIWGTLPPGTETPEGFRGFLYNSMSQIRNHISYAIPGASINLNSKADFVKEHLTHLYGEAEDIAQYGISTAFGTLAHGRNPLLTAEQFSLHMGLPLAAMLDTTMHDIFQRAARLHHEKIRMNEYLVQPTEDSIGYGAYIIDLNAHRRPPLEKPVARVA